MFSNYKNTLTMLCIGVSIFICQSFTQQKHEDDDKPVNLKVLPKNLSDEEIHKIMRGYSKSLGVKCGFCHQNTAGTPPHFDFASDAKPEKKIARKMITMVDNINKKYLSKIDDGKLEQIACVTCHMGNVKPIVSVDSLVRKSERPDSLRLRQFNGQDSTLRRNGFQRNDSSMRQQEQKQ